MRQLAGEADPCILPGVIVVGEVIDILLLSRQDDEALPCADTVVPVLEGEAAASAADVVDDDTVEGLGADEIIGIIGMLSYFDGVQVVKTRIEEQLDRCAHAAPPFL